jgi:hypothetical protein
MMRPAHVAAGFRNLFLGNSHNDLHDGPRQRWPQKAEPRSNGAAGGLL